MENKDLLRQRSNLRKVGHSGIYIDRSWFFSDELCLRIGTTVMIRMVQGDTDKISVFTKGGKILICEAERIKLISMGQSRESFLSAQKKAANRRNILMKRAGVPNHVYIHGEGDEDTEMHEL